MAFYYSSYSQKNYIIDTFLFNRSRIENLRVDVGRILCFPLTRPFVCECHNISTMPRFQSPPRQTQHTVFLHYAYTRPGGFIVLISAFLIASRFSSAIT